jgi:yecA family protein
MTDDEVIEPTGDFDELAAFLDRGDALEDWMPGSVLDGYLTGVAVSPIRLNPSDWMPKIWGGLGHGSIGHLRDVMT